MSFKLPFQKTYGQSYKTKQTLRHFNVYLCKSNKFVAQHKA